MVFGERLNKLMSSSEDQKDLCLRASVASREVRAILLEFSLPAGRQGQARVLDKLEFSTSSNTSILCIRQETSEAWRSGEI